ncbi:SLBB domain-containing protein [Halobacillus litoralis]|uniref:SLBB domain-containing protein n=1 Tax=Halobacillus litoralis TaxID=45668 RepID=UPI00273DE37A|nr:SLBB domain-containing protein [Halobacillus litoralis]WLR46206.1 SLBB domain-containing protein [Halobacillus litoralis]
MWIIIVLAVIAFLYLSNPSNEGEVQLTEVEEVTIQDTVKKNASSGSVKVDVKGEVHNPGVYTMTEETRVDDAIKKAGGNDRMGRSHQCESGAKNTR